MRAKGKLKSWSNQKGFGFITPFKGEKNLFIHVSGFSNRNRVPKIGDVVTYTVSSDKQGRPCATKATYAGEKAKVKSEWKMRRGLVVVASLFLLGVALSVLVSKIPIVVLVVYVSISVLTFIVYALDKSAAKRDAWRTPESTLHLLSILCGWPGAMAAQEMLRHKSSKTPFRVVFWITVILNFSVFMWLLTPKGAAVLNSFLSKF